MLLVIEKLAIVLFFILMVFFWYVTLKGAGTPLDRFVGKFTIIGTFFIPIGIFLTNRIFQLN